jgi:hypothetical protein
MKNISVNIPNKGIKNVVIPVDGTINDLFEKCKEHNDQITEKWIFYIGESSKRICDTKNEKLVIGKSVIISLMKKQTLGKL